MSTGVGPEPENPVCPQCGQAYRPGELACTRCGFVFSQAGKTHKIEETEAKRKNWSTGEAILSGQKPITFEIDGKVVTLPTSDVVTVGRASNLPNDTPPDVDLGSFGATDKGVSRHHIRIKRKGTLIYIVDLGSTNGTWLDGHRLVPNGERLLRSGDELQLGHLKVTVKF